MPDVNEQVTRLLAGVTADGVGEAFTLPRATRNFVFQAKVAGTGSVAATVTVEGSIDGVTWEAALATVELSGTGSDSGFDTLSEQPWPMLRGRVASLSGTGATVTLLMAI